MKRFIRILSFLLVISLFVPGNAYAASKGYENCEIVYYDDGSYMVIETTYIDTRATSTRVGYRTYTWYSAFNNEEWIATLSATFEYDKTTAVCLSSNCDVEIIDTNWRLESKSASKSGATATAQVTMQHKLLGITINTETIDLSLTCSPNGDFT